MSILKKKNLRFLVFIVFPLFVLGCSSNNGERVKTAEEIKVNAGAVLKSEEGLYKLYDYEEGKYVPIELNGIIVSFDKLSSSYICFEDKKHYSVHNGYKMEIKDEKYSDIKISPNGNYVSYFIEDQGLRLKVFTTNDGKEVNIKSNVSISGNLYDWYDENTLVYYGVNNEGVNGIFSYNLESNKEELIYKLQEGYLAFIKASKEDILFLQIDLENTKKLMMINKKSKEVKMLSDKIELLSDLIVSDDSIYFTGKIQGDNESLYRIKGDKVKRLIFDFPSIVKIDKGLSINQEGDILFIGSKGPLADESVYSFSDDGTITSRSKTGKEYIFLEYRE